MKEIVKVKHDHGVLSVRIPIEYVRAKGIKRSDCLIWVHNRIGDLVLKTLEEGIIYEQRDEVDKGKLD